MIHQVNIMNCVSLTKKNEIGGITAVNVTKKNHGHWRTQNAQPGASYGVQTENDQWSNIVLIGIFHPQLI